ncbi:MAG: hypothetical protein ACOXZH_00145 [Bacteroidales bacterium]
MMELMDTIHQTLHGWATTDFAPLIRTATQKIEASKGCQIYTMNYKTVWRELKRQNITEIIAEPKIKKEYKIAHLFLHLISRLKHTNMTYKIHHCIPPFSIDSVPALKSKCSWRLA